MEILIHAPDRSAVLEHGIVALVPVDGGGEAGGTEDEGQRRVFLRVSVDEPDYNDGA
jgi:hypothetical protein